MENESGHGQLKGSWGKIGRDFWALADDVLPTLPPTEQVLYRRLFRLSLPGAVRSPSVGMRTWRRNVGCRCAPSSGRSRDSNKQLVKTVWQSHGATTFTVLLVSQLGRRPAFLRGYAPLRSAPLLPL